jgi:hypothetical protein
VLRPAVRKDKSVIRMEFEIRFEQTRSFLRQHIPWKMLHASGSTAALVLLILAVVYSVRQRIGGEQAMAVFWTAACFVGLLIIGQWSAYRKTMQRHFGGREKIPFHMRFTDKGFHCETDWSVSFTKWEAVTRASRNARVFVLEVGSGEICMPMELLSEKELEFIEKKVFSKDMLAP